MGLLDVLPWRRERKVVSAGSDDLFDDAFQRKLEYLSLVSRRVFAGRLRAERRTKKSGTGVEFAEHRVYQPGDDFRYLDWSGRRGDADPFAEDDQSACMSTIHGRTTLREQERTILGEP
jgi:hypothetical protein